jgi:23S rRNA pseudouridine2605 synthase
MRKKQISTSASPPAERIQKVMASAGLGSRRAIEKRIGNGEVMVNNVQAVLGQTVSAGDTITCEDRPWRVVSKPVSHRSLIYNKPEGELTTRSDPAGRPTVFDRLPFVKNARWVAVGRLDINTTGLLLMTSDGELAHAMMHPSTKVDREYACRIRGEVSAEHQQNLLRGVELEDGPARFSDIREAGGSGENHWFHVTIMEGRNREVRRLWQSQGLTVSRLKRVRYGAVFLPKRLRVGHWSEITPREHEILREDVGLSARGAGLSLQSVRGRGNRSTGPKRKQSKKYRGKKR